jgi:hypothetical protein
MSEAVSRIPKLIATSVVRGAVQGDSHGGIFIVDFVAQQITQVVDWNTTEIDFQGRGWDRGLRGIAFHAGEIYVAASDELFVYDRAFNIQRSYRCSYLKHCHEIFALNDQLYLTSTGFDSILAFDLQTQAFSWALHIGLNGDEASGTPFDPRDRHGAGGPPAQNRLHLNNVYADPRGLFVSGMRTRGLLHVGQGNVVRMAVDMPEGIHNARPFRDGVLFNDTASDTVRYVGRDGTHRSFPVPKYDPADLERTDLGDDRLARQGFARGLCVIDERFIAAGSSPSTITLYDLEAGGEVGHVNFSMDVRNAIHGLEVWPFP